MAKNTPDLLDQKLIHLLSENGRIPVGDIAKRLGVTAPTVRSRMRALEEAGMLKVAGQINPERHDNLITALVGMNVSSRGTLDEVIVRLAALEPVTWVGVATGRYDVILEVVVNGGVKELFQVTSKMIPQTGVILKTETFVIMKSENKWVNLPKGLKEW